MNHGVREDYNSIQDLSGRIPEDEPVFLLRGQDVYAADTVRYWAAQVRGFGEKHGDAACVEIGKLAEEHAARMEAWVPKKWPDLPGVPALVSCPDTLTERADFVGYARPINNVAVGIERMSEIVRLPSYAHPGAVDAGMDLEAAEAAEIGLGETVLVPTGIRIALPPNLEGQIRPRSGLALKYGVTVANSPGTIDPGYRGEVGVILCRPVYGTQGKPGEKFKILPGDRIAQLVVAKFERVIWEQRKLDETVRGSGGFGSTGVNNNGQEKA